MPKYALYNNYSIVVSYIQAFKYPNKYFTILPQVCFWSCLFIFIYLFINYFVDVYVLIIYFINYQVFWKYVPFIVYTCNLFFCSHRDEQIPMTSYVSCKVLIAACWEGIYNNQFSYGLMASVHWVACQFYQDCSSKFSS